MSNKLDKVGSDSTINSQEEIKFTGVDGNEDGIYTSKFSKGMQKIVDGMRHTEPTENNPTPKSPK
jgi:hypothetical protein